MLFQPAYATFSMAFQYLKSFFIATSNQPKIERRDANNASTTTESLISIIEQDGGVIVENIITPELANQIRTDLKPYFDNDKLDPSGFFPSTTQRATGLLGISDACVELACNKTYIDIANKMIGSTYTYWTGQTQETVTTKPIISSTVGFRVNPGGRQQAIHRDDSDYHTRNIDMPMMLGCVTALVSSKRLGYECESKCVDQNNKGEWRYNRDSGFSSLGPRKNAS
jgi:ectoine hydroxylase-related dioxygenase (phytanoyl-CoA dioxygenase family)